MYLGFCISTFYRIFFLFGFIYLLLQRIIGGLTGYKKTKTGKAKMF